jgi:YD repeat-containing protein
MQAVTLGYKVHAWIDPVYVGTLDYCYDPYYLTTQFLVPDSTVTYIYTPTGTQTEKTAFTFNDSLLHPLIRQDQHFINDTFTVLHDYRYAFDANSAFLLSLSSGDISMKSTLLGFNYFQPLEVTTRKQRGSDTSFVEGTHYSFSSFPIFHSTYYYPSLVRHYTTPQNYRDINLVTYDSLGHLAEEYKTGDVHTVWLWGYNYTRPVAKISGTTYSTAMSYINNLTLQFPSSDNDIRTQVNAVRTGLAGSSALVTTYTYSTIFGMTSQVDAGGVITYYDYDSHGRLQDVRDMANRIIKRYSYMVNY